MNTFIITTIEGPFPRGSKDPILKRFQESRSRIFSKLRTYPGPSSSGSDYSRTGDLQRHWAVRVENHSDEVDIVAENSQRYAMFVHGDDQGDGQQDQHIETGWPNLLEVFEEESDDLASDVQDIIDSF